MPPPDKPRHHSGYQREETVLVEAACLTVAVTLGAMMDRLCIVGGLAPSLLIDCQADADPTGETGHAGTNDLDVGLAVALLDEQQYSEIARRLRQEDFEPDVNDRGNPHPSGGDSASSTSPSTSSCHPSRAPNRAAACSRSRTTSAP
jgi:hypothetical protein